MKRILTILLCMMLFGYLMAGSLAATCDINADGSVNALDLQVLINAILGALTASKYDVNQDGAVNALDLQALANVVLGTGTCPGSGNNNPPQLAGCQMFPEDNPWNRDISGDPVDPNSNNYIAYMSGSTKFLHPDFGSNPTYGIPFVVVPGTQTQVPMTFDYADESDAGPYPIPPNAPIEGGSNATGDRHILVLDKDHCKLYETWDSHFVGPGWHCGSGAIFDLSSNQLRPDYWTSADAAGLPILPGLARYDEAVTTGEIRHALRFTVASTQRAFIHPATHYASSNTSPNAPPMGLRLRLKAGYDISRFGGASKVILSALKKYGMVVADNGSDWFISGATDSRWDDNDLNQLKTVPGNAFEVIQSGPIIK
jgi:dockerin type I repeat protein